MLRGVGAADGSSGPAWARPARISRLTTRAAVRCVARERSMELTWRNAAPLRKKRGGKVVQPTSGRSIAQRGDTQFSVWQLALVSRRIAGAGGERRRRRAPRNLT